MYSRIELVLENEYPYFNIKEVSEISYTVFGVMNDGTKIDITDLCTVEVFDYNAQKLSNSIRLIETGTCLIKAFYSDSTRDYADSKEIVIYESFLRDNYLTHMVSNFEKEKIESNIFLKTLLDTCMEYFDILYAFNEDLRVMRDFTKVKSKFLSELGKSMGFEFFDQESINTTLEKQSQNIYRELLSNLIELVYIRGTKTAYKLFFSVLGYDIKLEEFWFDSDGNLIEINPDDFLITPENPTGQRLSTFYRYDIFGSAIDEPPVERPDPRRFANPNNDYDRNSKSNYVRPIISVRKDLENSTIISITDPGAFSAEKRRIINKFLEYLKPKHIQYLQELIKLPAFSETIGIEFLNEFSFSELADRLDSDDPDVGPWIDNIAEIIDNLFEEFISTLGINLNDTLDIPYYWDGFIKWDSGLRWDEKEIIFENFVIRKE